MQNNLAHKGFAAEQKHPGVISPGLLDRAIRIRTKEATEDERDTIATEFAIAMVYNDISHAVMMATPENLEEFAIGFSLTEGLIDRASDIRNIDVVFSELGVELNMEISSACFQRLKHRRRQLSGRTGCGLCGLASLEAAAPQVATVSPKALPEYASVNHAICELENKQVLQKKCGAVHAAAVANAKGDIQVLREDVGRHNALDKLIGACSALSLDSDSFVLVSSRASFEMVFKAASQGFSALVAVSAPTTMAIKLAQQANMNLLGFVRGGRQIIYNEAL